MMVGNKLKELRKRLGLTQEEMVAGIMSKSFYSKIENGKSEIKIADLLLILKKQKIALQDFFIESKLESIEDKLIEVFNNLDIIKLHQLIQSNALKGELLEQAKIINLILEGKTTIAYSSYKEKIRLEYLKVGSLDASHINKLRFALPFISSQKAQRLMKLILFNDEAKSLVKDKETLIALANISVDYLIRCHQENRYAEETKVINFILTLPNYPYLSLEKLVASYYDALIKGNKSKETEIIKKLELVGFTRYLNLLPQS